ncbi:MAG: hypothetical protein WCG06_03095 [Candidatus Omnitrophota bacterium]
MRKVKLLVAAVVACLAFARVAGAEDGALGTQLKAHEPVKVSFGEFVNQTGSQEVTAETFKKALEEALAARKSLRFELVSNPGDGRIQISGTLKKYQYLEKGPLKITPSLGMTAIDAVRTATGNYVEMEVELVVLEPHSGRILWKDVISTFLKEPMTQKQSVPRIYQKVLKSFLKNCFGKPK